MSHVLSVYESEENVEVKRLGSGLGSEVVAENVLTCVKLFSNTGYKLLCLSFAVTVIIISGWLELNNHCVHLGDELLNDRVKK